MGPLDTHPKDYGTIRVVTELIPSEAGPTGPRLLPAL